MIFPHTDQVARHPSQLYECLLEGPALLLILWLISRRPQPRGTVSAAFLITYGIFRFCVEFTRQPDDFLGYLQFGLSMGQWLSLPMVVAGLVMLGVILRRKPA